ncbi:hypothetical protein EDD18DRAFT_1359597 [Armillaria luteobubalina]|uniref:Uncharacterized protein n=1 Tax=Armillaria luteobubalina TaxID=153913 RepID=A0AA39PQG7_9AGAR|nr:hypothetical protein EDD18DRAFT_1359597 [Armillaria luteobubalina]
MPRTPKIKKNQKKTRYVHVNPKPNTKPVGKQWKPQNHTQLGNLAFFAGSKKRDYSNTEYDGDVGHGPWDDEPSVCTEPYMDSRWTTWAQYQFLKHRVPLHDRASLEKNTSKFMEIMLNLFAHHWLPIHGSAFIDPSGVPRRMPVVLRNVKNSPPDTPYPKMTNGDLDLGPHLALDGCLIIGILASDTRLKLGIVMHQKQGHIKQWFYNYKKKRSAGVKVVVKEQSNGKCMPHLDHIYLNMFFTPECLIEEVTDKAMVQGTKQNIDIISKVTMEAWANTTPEIREEVMEEWEKRIKQLVALRACRFKDIILTEEERIQVIEGLGVQLKKQFELETSLSKFGFVIVAAGYHPGKKRMESYSWEFRTEDSMGKTFIKSFDKAAKSGVVPGGQKGDRRDMKTYYGLPLLAYMLEFEALNERQQSELLDATSSDDDDDVDDIVAGNVLPLHGTSMVATNEGSVVAGMNVPPANDFDDGPIPNSLSVSFWWALVPASPYFPNPQERSSDSYELSQFNSENRLPVYHESVPCDMLVDNGNLNWSKVFSQWDLSGSNFFSPSLNYASGARSPLAFLNPFPVAPPFVPPTIMPSVNEMEMMEVEKMLAPLATTTCQECTPPDRPMVLSSRASSEQASLSSSIVDERAAVPLTLQLSNERALAILHHVPNERAATPLPINSNKWVATPNEWAPAPDIPCQP